MVRRAEIAQPRVRLARDLLKHRLREARFANAGLADQHHHPALAGLGLLPAALQQRQLLVAADERGQVSPVQCLEPALGDAPAQYPRGHHRRAQALELDGAQVHVLEETAGQPPRARRDHHRARFGQRLQPRREVGRLSDHRLFLRGTLADQIADHHQPGSDADPHLQPHRRDGVEPGHLLHQLQCRAHRALGIVLVGPRIAEIGEHAVADVLGDKPAAAADHLGNAAVIGADDLTQILRVEPRRQRRGADEIAEHHRQLPPLGLVTARRRCFDYGRLGRAGRCAIAQGSDRIDQSAPVPHRRDPDFLQVVRGQTRQHLPIDLIVAERRLVALQPQTFQPRRYVHVLVLRAEEASNAAGTVLGKKFLGRPRWHFAHHVTAQLSHRGPECVADISERPYAGHGRRNWLSSRIWGSRRTGGAPLAPEPRAGNLQARLQDHVERRLRGASDATEPAGGDDLAQLRLAGLRAESRADLLRQ